VNRAFLTRFAWISIAAALVTMGLKTAAFFETGSVGLLSDAIESLVNLFGGLMALAMLTVAARPPDEDHAYGHGKAEYFSSGVEGTLISIAALSIGVTGGGTADHAPNARGDRPRPGDFRGGFAGQPGSGGGATPGGAQA